MEVQSAAQKRPGLAVVIPGREEAAERIAAVLQRNGLLSAMHVPLNLTRPWQFARAMAGAKRQPAPWLAKWAYRIPAQTSAPLAEVVSASALRLPELGRYRRRAVVSWRNSRTDAATARALVSGRAAGALAVLGWPSRSLEVCAEMSLPGFLYVQMDIWGVNRSLVREACESSARTSRGEPLLERDLVFEENATLAVARASHFVVQSERMAQRVRELSGVHRPTIVLGLGVDLPARLPYRDHEQRPLRVLTVARVGYAKGIHYVGDAIRAAGEHVQSAVVAGGGLESFPILRRRAAGLQFLGHRSWSDLARLYVEADVFVLATFADAMARTVMEAMASGLPVIITRESGYEGVVQDGVQGFFVPAGNSDAIAEKLAILATDGELRFRMGRAARELANTYGWDTFEEAVRTRLVPVVAEALSVAPSLSPSPLPGL